MEALLNSLSKIPRGKPLTKIQLQHLQNIYNLCYDQEIKENIKECLNNKKIILKKYKEILIMSNANISEQKENPIIDDWQQLDINVQRYQYTKKNPAKYILINGKNYRFNNGKRKI